jgi:hypothetical protein
MESPSSNHLLFDHLQARHRVVSADLKAIVARADERRLATKALHAETAELLAELRRQSGRTGATLERCAEERSARLRRSA